jgi:uncharacterized lipoprotein YddW (UPF0748 family)
LALILSFPAAVFAQAELWLTNPDKSALFQKQSAPLTFAAAASANSATMSPATSANCGVVSSSRFSPATTMTICATTDS